MGPRPQHPPRTSDEMVVAKKNEKRGDPQNWSIVSDNQLEKPEIYKDIKSKAEVPRQTKILTFSRLNDR